MRVASKSGRTNKLAPGKSVAGIERIGAIELPTSSQYPDWRLLFGNPFRSSKAWLETMSWQMPQAFRLGLAQTKGRGAQ